MGKPKKSKKQETESESSTSESDSDSSSSSSSSEEEVRKRTKAKKKSKKLSSPASVSSNDKKKSKQKRKKIENDVEEDLDVQRNIQFADERGDDFLYQDVKQEYHASNNSKWDSPSRQQTQNEPFDSGSDKYHRRGNGERHAYNRSGEENRNRHNEERYDRDNRSKNNRRDNSPNNSYRGGRDDDRHGNNRGFRDDDKHGYRRGSRDNERLRNNDDLRQSNKNYRNSRQEDNHYNRDNKRSPDRRQNYGSRENYRNNEQNYRQRNNRDNYNSNNARRSEERQNDRRDQRERSWDRGKRSGRNSRSRSPHRPRNFPRHKKEDDKQYEWGGHRSPKKEKSPSKEKEKPNFALSGKLTEDANTVNGVVIKYSEPLEARKPRRRWRLYPFKGEKAMPTLYIHRQSCFLVGRDRKVCDLPVDHPSCSKQHAVIQYRLIPFERDDGTIGQRVRPYLLDLESANGTFLNNKKVDSRKYIELIEKDVIKFGFSSREYVLLHENSKEDALDDDVIEPVTVKQEPEG